jgi:hypothetical protein
LRFPFFGLFRQNLPRHFLHREFVFVFNLTTALRLRQAAGFRADFAGGL